MGKYNGRVLTVYIAPSGVRVIDGENKNGDPNINKFFTIPDVDEYFTASMGASPYEISNMSSLVKTIVDSCREYRVSTKKVMVCSDCFGIETGFTNSLGAGSIKQALSGDIKSLFKKTKGGDDDIQTTPDKMVVRCSWGELIRDGVSRNMITKTSGDRYMLKSLVQEFYKYGYEVIFISGTQEVLINFRQTDPANFDSQGKVIFDFDIDCRSIILLKDVPVEFPKLNFVDDSELLNRMMSMLKQSLVTTGRNPTIYITGTRFVDCYLYNELVSGLETEGYTVYDLFNHPELPENYESLLAMGEVEPILTPDYSANIALMMSAFASTVIQLTPNVELYDMIKKNAQTVATLALVAAGVFVVATGVLAGLRFFNIQNMEAHPSDVDSLNAQIATLTSRQQSLQETLNTLTKADTSILDLLEFVEANQSDRVYVVSIDTTDQLPNTTDEGYGLTTEVTGTAEAVGETVADTVEEVTPDGPSAERQKVVIRGYAKTSPEAVAYYNQMYNSGLPISPVLNGIEEYSLPDGDKVYIFEIEVRGSDDLE